MINFLVAYDNIDVSVGTYLDACFIQATEIINTIGKTYVQTLDAHKCTATQIETSINGFKGNKFFFLAYTHGNENALTAIKNEYVNVATATKFQNSFFYTCACLCAVNLGPALERNGCLVFLGYNQEVKMPNLFSETFRKCKNSGIEYFLKANNTVEDTYKHMLNVYEEEFLKLSAHYEDSFLAAAFLRSNMNALVCLGNKHLTVEDFYYDE